MKIIPSLMCGNLLELGSQIKILDKYVDGWHVDIMDGNFVPNITLGFDLLDQVKKIAKAPIEVHLMVKNPLRYVERVSGVDKVFIHIECLDKAPPAFENQNIGLAINVETKIEELPLWLYDFNDFLIMSVPTGFSGKEFNYSVIDKIQKIQERTKGNSTICVDGGANPKTIPVIKEAGTSSIVVGTYIFRRYDLLNALNEIKNVTSLLECN